MRTFLPTPFLTQKEVQQILDTLAQGYPESQTRWRLKLSTLPLSEEEKDAVNEVFQFLLERLDRLLSDPAAGARQMRKLFLSRSDILRPSHMVLIISMLEEIAVELILQNSALDIHVGFRWIHSSLLNMAFSSFLGESVFPRNHGEASGASNSDTAFEEGQMELYEAIIRYDEALLTLNGLEDILSYSVREICRIAGFARAADFTGDRTNAWRFDRSICAGCAAAAGEDLVSRAEVIAVVVMERADDGKLVGDLGLAGNS